MSYKNIMSYYAVAKGRIPGIYYTWDECKAQTNGYPDSKFKKFGNENMAKEYINKNSNDIFMPIFNLTPKNIYTTIPIIDTDGYKGTSGLTDEGNGLVVWTDGGCRNNGTNKELGGVGVYFAYNHPCNISYKMIGTPETPVTNNRAEMLAVIMAMQKIKNEMPVYKKIEIRTDSQYIVNVMTIYMQQWINKNNTSYKNKDLWDQLMTLTKYFDIKWTHVRGHAGVYGNEQADMLVNKAIDS